MSDPVKVRMIEAQIIEGLSPEVTLTPKEDGVEMAVTTKSGTKRALIPKGDTYELTVSDKTEIAQLAFNEYAESATEHVLESEGFAVGKRGGVDVDSDSPYYHNNAKYYAEQAAGSNTAAQAAKTAAQEAAATASAAYGTDLLAPDFSTSSTYAVGDYVIHSGDLYRCTTAVTTAGEWNNSSWTQVAVGGEVGALKSAINASLINTTVSGWESGTFDSTNGNNYSASSRIRNQKTFGLSTGAERITVDSGFSALLFAWDTNGTFIGSYKASGNFDKTTSNFQYVNDFDLSAFPDYVVKVSVKNNSSDTISTSDGTNCHFHMVTDKTLSMENKAADAKMVGDGFSKVDGNFNAIVEKQFSVHGISSYQKATKIAGYSFGIESAVKISGSANSSYDSYYFYTDSETALYFASSAPSTPTYIALTVGFNPSKEWVTAAGQLQMSCTGASRKRNSENNLPTSSAPMDVSEAIVIITVNASTSVSFSINDALKIKPDVLPASEEKKPLLRYNSTYDTVYIYIPNITGYVRYAFSHVVNASINADIWRVYNAVHVDDVLTQDYILTADGEWELAIKISGRLDFSGGSTHGDEVKTGITWILDGKPVDITTYSNYTEFTTLMIAEQSELYDPNDSTTVFAEHNSLHIFDVSGLTIRQVVKYVLSETISTAYMAMLPIAQAVSDKIITNNDYKPVATSNKILSGVTDAILYDNNSSVQTRFYVSKFDFLDTSTTFICNDNGGTNYHKCYFVNVIADKSISSGAVWESETKYEFVTGIT